MSAVVTSFYAERNWRDRFNVLRPNGTRHRGLDIGVAGRGVIPALRAGVVSSVNRSSVLGFVVSVRVDGGGYDGYAHVYGASAIPVGRRVAPGTTIGRAATFGDYTGTAWSGPHLHFTTGFTPAIWQGVGVIDPAPVILRVLASFANTKPPVTIPDKPKPNPETVQEDDNMLETKVIQFDNNGKPEWTIASVFITANPSNPDGGYYVTQNKSEAIAQSRLTGAGFGTAPSFVDLPWSNTTQYNQRRDELIAIQNAAKKNRANYLATMKSIHG